MIISALHTVSSEHINILFEDGTEIRSTLGVITEMMLFRGKELDDSAVEQLRALSAKAFAVEKAVELLSYRQMSGKEMRSKLIRKGFEAEAAEAAVAKLFELRLLDDEQYAAAVVRHYTAKGYGAGRIRAELAHRGVDRDYWDEALAFASGSDDKLISYIRSHLRDPDDRDQKRKVSAALYRRGYSWDEIRSALSRFSSGSEDDYE
ncbi:MAG: RecX family transcriptional regulator [Oscillospiraceae bacterium]|nr:RecX family transcriptional regulator [Oscillospiraceae bacterium]MBR0391679.1 RecX family transcriptional regulator [Oscillospiraceae bacterium]